MPITPRGYEARPYVRPAYEPDTRTLQELMRMAGESKSRAVGQRGQQTAQALFTLGQLLSQGLGGLRQERAQKEAAAFEQQKYADELQRKQFGDRLNLAQFQALEEERAANRAAREEAARVAQEATAYKRGGEVAEEVGYGPMSEPQLESVMQGPAAGRARYVFGPGTAEGPELQPTKAQQRGIETEKAIREMGGLIGPNGQVVMPPKPEREPNPTEASLAMMAARGDANAARALERLRSLRAPQTEQPLIPIIGPDGKTRYGTRAEARGQIVPSGQNKPATGLEKRALNFFNRAAQADADLEGLEAQVQSLNLPGQTYMEWAPNFMQTDLGQQYTQAQRAFTEARLRKDSGAAIPEQEFANDRRTYFAQPGDSQETLEQKRRARAAVLASLGFESGQALGEFVGDADEARRMVEGFKARAAKPATGAKVRMRAPDGSVSEVDPSLVKHYESLGAKVVK